MSRPGPRAVGAVVIAAMVWSMGTACNHKPTRPPERTAWQKIMDLTGPNGEVSTQMALQAFALTIGPLPGVNVPLGPPGPVVSGTPAVEWVLGHWTDLTTEQRRQVEAHLGLGLPLTGGLGGAPGRAVPMAPPPPTDLPPLTCDRELTVPAHPAAEEGQAMVGALVPLIESLLHVDFNARLVVCLASGNPPAETNWAGRTFTVQMFTVPWLHDDGSYDCRITLFRAGQELPDSQLAGQQRANTPRRRLLLHELMHCFIYRMVAKLDFRTPPFPPWVKEGIPEWVADQISGIGSTFWPDYLRYPESALVRRSYDAVGFFSHLQNVHQQMWDTIPKIVQESVRGSRTNSEAAFDAAVLPDRAAALNTLPSSWLRQRNRGAPSARTGVGPWDITGVGIPTDHPNYEIRGSVKNDGPDVSVASEAWASELAETDLRADVVTISAADGNQNVYGRFGPGATGDYPLADAMTRVFCAKRGGCTCKDGTAPVTFTNIDPGLARVAVTGGTLPAGVLLHGSSLEKFCAKRKPGKSGRLALPDPCKLVTQEEATQAAGEPVKPGIRTAVSTSEGSIVGDGVACTFVNVAPRTGFPAAAVRLDAYDLGDDAAATFQTIAAKLAPSGADIRKVDNLGDDNVYICAPPGCSALLYVRRANIVLQFSVLTADGLNQASHLAILALGRM
jgi:hypothetical protein